MSRRRSSNPTKAISVTIPESLLKELEHRLSYSQSRSRFISNAIEDKLGGVSAPTVQELTTVQLKSALHQRICGCHETASCPTNILLRNLSTS